MSSGRVSPLAGEITPHMHAQLGAYEDRVMDDIHAGRLVPIYMSNEWRIWHKRTQAPLGWRLFDHLDLSDSDDEYYQAMEVEEDEEEEEVIEIEDDSDDSEEEEVAEIQESSDSETEEEAIEDSSEEEEPEESSEEEEPEESSEESTEEEPEEEEESSSDDDGAATPPISPISRRFALFFSPGKSTPTLPCEVLGTTTECSICYDPIPTGEAVYSIPCSHRFHDACITPWLRQRPTCPNCRHDVRGPLNV